MIQLHLWLVLDHTPGEYRRGPEFVACSRGMMPNDIVNVPDTYAQNIYIGEYDGGPIYPWTETDAGIEQIQQPSYEQIQEDSE